MVKLKNNEKGKYYDGYLKKNLNRAIEEVKNKWDMVFVVDGIEGSGKSKFARQCAAYTDPNFNLKDNIVFTPKQFKDKIKNAEKHKAIVYDEAMSGLNSRATMSQVNKTLVNMFSTIRRKGLFIFVVLPTFFDLDKYVAIHRSRGLFHVYAENFKRGKFMFFDIDRKKSLYLNGKKFYSYAKPKANFIGSFTSWDPINEEEYEIAKEKSLIDEDKKEKKVNYRVVNIMRQRAILLRILVHHAKFTYKQIVKCCAFEGLKVTERNLKTFIDQMRLYENRIDENKI